MLRSERISESLRLGTILSLAGGFMDAYSYSMRGGVFANAETGNIVLMGLQLLEGDLYGVLHYALPVGAFALGVFAAEVIRRQSVKTPSVHWKEWVLAAEILIAVITGFIPQAGNHFVNVMISFICAMQVQAFRKVRGKGFATTMCTGNLRSGTELLASGLLDHKEGALIGGAHYYWIDLTFIGGAFIGAFFSKVLAERAIWICAVLLFACLVFIRYHKKNLEV